MVVLLKISGWKKNNKTGLQKKNITYTKFIKLSIFWQIIAYLYDCNCWTEHVFGCNQWNKKQQSYRYKKCIFLLNLSNWQKLQFDKGLSTLRRCHTSPYHTSNVLITNLFGNRYYMYFNDKSSVRYQYVIRTFCDVWQRL